MGCGSSAQGLKVPIKNDPAVIPAQRSVDNLNGDNAVETHKGVAQDTVSKSDDSLKPGNKVDVTRRQNTAANTESQKQPAAPNSITAGLVGSEPMPTDQRACPEHFYLIFSLWPVVRPGVPEFLKMLSEKKRLGEVQHVYIYTANTSLHWVRFIMQCIMHYYAIALDTFDGIKHAPGGLKVVPDGAVLYDDHPENAIGNCVAVDPYTNEIPWEILGPILQKLPDHTEASCPLWDECGGLQKFIERDQQYEDPPHNETSETTMFDLIQEFVPHDEVLIDLDETLIAGARLSAYFNALNHFLMFREDVGETCVHGQESVRQAEAAAPT